MTILQKSPQGGCGLVSPMAFAPRFCRNRESRRYAAMKRYKVGAYYFPNYHVDPRNERVHGPGWSEWELVKRATPRFPDHQQPNEPARGYLDEADSEVMSRKLITAAENGVDYFIFDMMFPAFLMSPWVGIPVHAPSNLKSGNLLGILIQTSSAETPARHLRKPWQPPGIDSTVRET